MNVLFIYSGNSASGRNSIVENQAASLVSAGINIELYPIRGKGLRGYSKYIRNIKRLLSQQRFDIIHAHYGLSGFVCSLARKNEKLLVSYMGSDLIGSIKRNPVLNSLNIFVKFLNVLSARFIYDFTIVKSEEMASRLWKNTKFAVIPNGVLFDVFFPVSKALARRETGIKDSSKIILFVSDPGRPEKNYSLAVKAVELLNDNNIEILTIYNKPVEVLRLYYSSADVLLITSIHEGSPNAVKEAMACNCPVVSTDVGDVKWLFGNSQGHFLTSFDHTDVSDKLRTALSFTGSTNGRERLTELKLDSRSTAVRIKELYNTISGN